MDNSFASSLTPSLGLISSSRYEGVEQQPQGLSCASRIAAQIRIDNLALVSECKKDDRLERKKNLCRALVKRCKKMQRTPPFAMDQAMRVSSMLQQRPDANAVLVKGFIREPLENLQKMPGLLNSEHRFARLISFERFQTALRENFFVALTQILASPETERDYIIVADEGTKSTNWVVSQVLDMTESHLPKAIIPRERVHLYLQSNPNVKHIILIDDGAYSGDQMSGTVATLNKFLEENRAVFHVVVPFTTSVARAKIMGAAKGRKCTIFSSRTMLTYQELYKSGVFGYLKTVRPDISRLLKIEPLRCIGLIAQPEIMEVKGLNDLLEQCKKTVFKSAVGCRSSHMIDLRINGEIDELMQIAEKIKLYLHRYDANMRMIDTFITDLLQVKSGIERFGWYDDEHEIKFNKYKESIGYGAAQVMAIRTATWMAHKSADEVSTDEEAMLQATGGVSAIEPYKEGTVYTKARIRQIIRLQEAFPAIVQEWGQVCDRASLHGVRCVVSNRGYFLIGDNYEAISHNDNNKVLIGEAGKQLFPMGEKEGTFHFKLTKGMEFTLVQNNKECHLKFTEDGAFIILP